MSRSSFLAARTAERDIGLESSVVSRVVPAHEWAGTVAVDLELLSFGHASEDTAVHIIVVKSGTGERAIATSRPLVLRDCPSADVHPLPAELWALEFTPAVSRVHCADNMPPLLILDPQALAHDQAIPVLSGDLP